MAMNFRSIVAAAVIAAVSFIAFSPQTIAVSQVATAQIYMVAPALEKDPPQVPLAPRWVTHHQGADQRLAVDARPDAYAHWRAHDTTRNV